MPVYTNVLIYLNDINDNAPQINLTLPGTDPLDYDMLSNTPSSSSSANLTLSSSNQLELSEYTAPNTFIAQIIVADADSGTNGQLTLDMRQFKKSMDQHKWLESQDFELVHLFNNIYSLMTKCQLDRELFDEYKIEVMVKDGGQPKPLENVLEIVIKLKDENDNKPMFVNLTSANGYEFNITELGRNFQKFLYIFLIKNFQIKFIFLFDIFILFKFYFYFFSRPK